MNQQNHLAKISAPLLIVLSMQGCGGPGQSPGTPSASSSGSSGSISTSSSSSGTVYSNDPEVQSYCEDIYSRYGQNASSSGGPKYPLIIERDMASQAPATLGGGFEDASIEQSVVAFNRDPMYVFAGEASGLIEVSASDFLGSISDNADTVYEALSVWMYLDSPVALEMEIEVSKN